MTATLRALPLDLPLARPFRTSRGAKTVARNVLVEISSDGITGRGEGAPIPRYGQDQASSLAALTEMAVPEASPFEQDVWLDAFDSRSPGQLAARAALECALWDWAGRATGQRVYDLLSIDPAAAPASSYTISVDEPAAIRERVMEASSWPVLKLKMAGGDADAPMVEALKEVCARPFRVDANEAWSYDEAVEKISWLANLGCEMVEQPLPAGQLDLAARLRESSPLPLAADEDAVPDADRGAVLGAYDLVNVKITRLGGLRRAIEWLHAARQAGCGTMVGCFAESSLAISASAVLAPLCDAADLDGAALLSADPFRGASVHDGVLVPATGPGFGAEPAGSGQ